LAGFQLAILQKGYSSKISNGENSMDNKKSVILSIDFGHGETSASLLKMNANNRCEDVGIFNVSKPTIPSYVMKDQRGNVLVGEYVVNKLGLGNVGEDVVAQISWKKRPSEMTPTEYDLASEFMGAVYKKIIEQSDVAKDAVVWLALPSGWRSKKEKRSLQEEVLYNPEYIGFMQIAKDAGIEDVRILPESRAALIGIRIENPDMFLGDIINKGVVVIDAGSSTLDVSYIKVDETGKIHVEDEGFNLGASLIDEMLRDAAIDIKKPEEKNNILRVLENKPALRTYVTNHFRRMKEEYFESKGVVVEHTPVYITDKECTLSLGNGFSLPSELDSKNHVWNSKLISLVVPLQYSGTGKTWKEHLKACLTSCKEMWNLKSLGVVTFVGGASNMPFVIDVAKDVFGSKVERYYCPPNPSLAVSHGIAYAARATMAAEAFCVALDNRYKQLVTKNEDYWRKTIVPIIGGRIGKQICQTVVPAILKRLEARIAETEGDVILGKILSSINDFSAQNTINNILKTESAIPLNEFFSIDQNIDQNETRICIKLENQLFYGDVFILWSEFCQAIAIKNINPSDMMRDEHLTKSLCKEIYSEIDELTKTIVSNIYPTVAAIIRDSILGVLLLVVIVVIAAPVGMFLDLVDFYRKHFESEDKRIIREAKEKVKEAQAKVKEEKRLKELLSKPLTERQAKKLCDSIREIAQNLQEGDAWSEKSPNEHAKKIVSEIKRQINTEEITNKLSTFLLKTAEVKKSEIPVIVTAVLN